MKELIQKLVDSPLGVGGSDKKRKCVSMRSKNASPLQLLSPLTLHTLVNESLMRRITIIRIRCVNTQERHQRRAILEDTPFPSPGVLQD